MIHTRTKQTSLEGGSQALRIGCQDDFMGARNERNDMKPVTAPSVKFTYEDVLNFPNDGKRHEMPF